jgi:hypothetical protein
VASPAKKFGYLRQSGEMARIVKAGSGQHNEGISIKAYAMNSPPKCTEQAEGLDGSAASMHRLLGELVSLAGQADESHTAPVLELQFGDLITRTSIRQRDDVDYVVVVVELPKLDNAALMTGASSASGIFQADEGDAEMLWHAEKGRHVVVRHIPVAVFPDEASVFDAIMDSADRVSAWLAAAIETKHLRTVAEAGR